MIIVLMIIICILLILLIRKPKNIIIHNKSDILKGIELERRKQKYREYLDSYYRYSMPPPSVREGYKEIEKEVLGYYL